MAAYEHALQALHRAPLAEFLPERKRLADDLRAKGDKSGATQLARVRKPTASVWAVNQLYARARDAFQEMLATAERVRKGDLSATKAHQAAIAKLRKRAAALLEEAGLGASDAVLRRIATTLSAIAAAGGFDPDPPGALAADRDPPGFEAIGILPEKSAPLPPSQHPAGQRVAHHHVRDVTAPKPAKRDAAADRARLRAIETKRRTAERAEKKRRDAERARRRADAERVRKAILAGKKAIQHRERVRSALAKRLAAAEEALADSRKTVADLENELTQLRPAD